MASMNAQAAETMVGSPMHQAYASVAPRPEDWPMLAAKLGQLLRQDYDWPTAVAAIKAPTLLVIGNAGSVRPAHAQIHEALLSLLTMLPVPSGLIVTCIKQIFNW